MEFCKCYLPEIETEIYCGTRVDRPTGFKINLLWQIYKTS